MHAEARGSLPSGALRVWLGDQGVAAASPPLTGPGHDRTHGHSPDAFVEAEKLLVGQPLALEDGDHPVVDAAGGERGVSSRPRDPSPPPQASLPRCLSPAARPALLQEQKRAGSAAGARRLHGCSPGVLSTPASVPTSLSGSSPSPSLPRAPGLSLQAPPSHRCRRSLVACTPSAPLPAFSNPLCAL